MDDESAKWLNGILYDLETRIDELIIILEESYVYDSDMVPTPT